MIEMISKCDEIVAKQLQEIEDEIFTTAWPSETTVSYTHLTLPTILRV